MAQRMTVRKKRSLATRDRIQQAAFELFREQGYENVSMQEIAERSGCTAGNLYHYYKNKDALILQVFDHVDAVYDRLMRELPQGVSGLDRLGWFVRRAILESNQETVVSMSFAHALRYPELGTMDTREDRPYYRHLAQLIEACKAEGSIAARYETGDVIRKIIVIQRGILFQWRVECGCFSAEEMTDHLVGGLLASLKQ